MAFKLSQGSLDKLKGIHPDLVKVVNRALELTPTDFSVVYGLRTTEEQKALVADGKSKTINSRHLTGHAVDLRPICKVNIDSKEALPYFNQVSLAMKAAAKEFNTPIEWGGDWGWDYFHYELTWKAYPLK